MYVDDMAPMYGQPNYDFGEENPDDPRYEDTGVDLTHMAFWYMMVLIILLLSWLIIFFLLRLVAYRQKTRNSQQRQVYVGSRTRQLSVEQPTIYVSPANLPPPPKYEAMAPPSYDEVMGMQYPSYPVQPITHPLTHAMAQSSSNVEASTTNDTAPAVVTVTNEERRSSVTVRS